VVDVQRFSFPVPDPEQGAQNAIAAWLRSEPVTVRAHVRRAYLWKYKRTCPECGEENIALVWHPTEEFRSEGRMVAILCGKCDTFIEWQYGEAGHLIDPKLRYVAELKEAADSGLEDDGEWGDLPVDTIAPIESLDDDDFGSAVVTSVPAVVALPEDDF
jgi:hypothetical protein